MSAPRYETRLAWFAPSPVAALTLAMAALRSLTRSVMSVAALALMPARVVGTVLAPLLPEDPGAAAAAVPATATSVAPEARAMAPSRVNRVCACSMRTPLVRAPPCGWPV
jgi:hypothetical protein